MRMDRYEEVNNENEKEEKVLSRIEKNHNMYNDVYNNSSYVDFNNVLNVDEVKEELDEVNEETFENELVEYDEKNYNINDYIEKARENYHPDSDIRSLNNQEFIEVEDEISNLIEEIDKKDDDEEFFSDLMGENEDTMVEGQLIKEEDVTYKKIFSTEFFEDEAKLEKALGSETMTELKLEEEGISNTFQDILGNEGFSNKKKRNIAIVFFSITLFILIVVIILVILFK